jgi:uncharacterized membrane protein
MLRRIGLSISIFAFFLGAHLTDALLSPNFVKIYHNTADDMIVTGKTEQEHLKNLDNVLSRMQRFGLRANLSKCYFFKENVKTTGLAQSLT